MPELPEVETIVRGLARTLPGQRIVRVVVARSDLLGEPAHRFRRALQGSRIEEVSRRGKNIVLSLSGLQVLRVHLGMTGRLLYSAEPLHREVPAYRGVSLGLEARGTLHYADARRFGHLRRMKLSEWEGEARRLGPEPLGPEWTTASFRQALARSRSPIRSWLLDQRRVAGIGNIYANEALFRAGIHPARPAHTLGPDEARRLRSAVRRVLRDAVRARGTTLRDYRTSSGDEGGYGLSLRVYGREGDPCPACNGPVSRIVFGNRSAFLCPRCQREDP